MYCLCRIVVDNRVLLLFVSSWRGKVGVNMEGSLLLLNSFIVPMSVVDIRSDTKKGYMYDDDHAEMALGIPVRELREKGSLSE